MDITITTLGGNTLNLRVNPTDTVGSLKTLIQKEWQEYAPESQKLTFVNGKKIILDNDSMTIGSYGLHSGCQVSLLVTQPAPIQVFLRKDGKNTTYDIKPDETVSNFRRRVQSRTGVQNDQFRLVHGGRDMMDGKLAHYGVIQHSTIDMSLRVRGG